MSKELEEDRLNFRGKSALSEFSSRVTVTSRLFSGTNERKNARLVEELAGYRHLYQKVKRRRRRAN